MRLFTKPIQCACGGYHFRIHEYYYDRECIVLYVCLYCQRIYWPSAPGGNGAVGGADAAVGGVKDVQSDVVSAPRRKKGKR